MTSKAWFFVGIPMIFKQNLKHHINFPILMLRNIFCNFFLLRSVSLYLQSTILQFRTNSNSSINFAFKRLYYPLFSILTDYQYTERYNIAEQFQILNYTNNIFNSNNNGSRKWKAVCMLLLSLILMMSLSSLNLPWWWSSIIKEHNLGLEKWTQIEDISVDF